MKSKVRESKKKSVIAKIARIRTAALAVVMLLSFTTSWASRLSPGVSETMEPYKKAQSIDSLLLDDSSLSSCGMDDFTDLGMSSLLNDPSVEKYMEEAIMAIVKSSDRILVAIMKHYAIYAFLFIWMIFIFQTVGFMILVWLAMRYRRNILPWCVLGALISPYVATVILYIIRERKTFESQTIA